MLARIYDKFHSPAHNRHRARARQGARLYVHKLDIQRARFRDWFFADPYVPPDLRPCPADTNPMEFLMDSHDDDRDAILPSDITPQTLAQATDARTLPDPATFARLQHEARTRDAWSQSPTAPEPPDPTPTPDYQGPDHDTPEPTPRAGRPRRATVQRQAMIYSLFHDPYELALTGHLTPLEIMEAVSRRLIANGHLLDGARLAAQAAPYRHPRLDLESRGGTDPQPEKSPNLKNP